MPIANCRPGTTIIALQLTIEKLVYGGDGIARLPADEKGRGKAAFVPFVLPGEQIEARTVEETPGYVRAEAEKILTASARRIAPKCPYFGRCGGCHYQHTAYENQLEIKSGILKETVRRLAKLELPQILVHPSPPWNYRNRTRLKVRGGQDFALGYHRFGSHELLPVEECPISSALINRAITATWELGRAGKVSEAILEMEFFANAEDTQLLLELNVPDKYWENRQKPSVVDTAEALRDALPELNGIAVFKVVQGGSLVREEVPAKLREVFGDEGLMYDTANAMYQVSAGSFFQTNRFLTDDLIALVTSGRSGGYTLDLYAGTGLFALPLSQQFRQVAAVEAAPFSFHDLKQNCPSNVVGYRATTERFLTSVQHTAAFDYVVVDPPRSGLGETVALKLGELAPPQLTYVSCDPATLARDLRILAKSGFRVEQAHLMDLFPQTFHIESVLYLAR